MSNRVLTRFTQVVERPQVRFYTKITLNSGDMVKYRKYASTESWSSSTTSWRAVLGLDRGIRRDPALGVRGLRCGRRLRGVRRGARGRPPANAEAWGPSASSLPSSITSGLRGRGSCAPRRGACGYALERWCCIGDEVAGEVMAVVSVLRVMSHVNAYGIPVAP